MTLESQPWARGFQIGTGMGLSLANAVPVVFLAVLIVVMGMIAPNFLSVGNFLDIARVVSITGIMAVGMTIVILTGGIDLSVGSIFAFGAVVAASFVPGSFTDGSAFTGYPLPVALAVALGVVAGGVIGYVNGSIIARSGVEPFIVTLATMAFVRGLTYLYTGGFPTVFPSMPAEFQWLGQGFLLGIPTPTVLFFLIAAVCVWVLRSTPFGRSVYAIGGNKRAAALSGIDVARVQIRAYTILGALAAFSGIVLASRLSAAQPTAGLTYELDVIAAVVIGGTSLFGGRGSLLNTVVGVFILGVIANGMNIIGVPTYYQYFSKGLLIVVAVGLDARLNNGHAR